ncbi:hypothetical protein [Rhizobium giardinii]|uniref:hypothetical protein n=1 Tax=Rhizobium giardinii TaxID=56731 RepID=UPI003D6F96AF
MIPTIRLNWKRYTDGFKAHLERPNVFVPQSERIEPLFYEAGDLENPVVLHFINCRSAGNYIAFLSRFGPLDGGDLVNLKSLIFRAYAFRYNALFTIDNRSAPQERMRFLNTVMKDISLRPTFLSLETTGNGQLVLEAATLDDFMVMELAAIHEAGAVATSCEHCRKAFLTGPRTGRRSHAKYCSDRCRVAAMRARNAAKEED